MVFQILLNFYLNRLGTLRMQNLIMLKKKRNDTMLFKQLLHFLAALVCCFLVLFNTKRHKFQFCYLLCVTHFLLDFTLQNYTIFPKPTNHPTNSANLSACSFCWANCFGKGRDFLQTTNKKRTRNIGCARFVYPRRIYSPNLMRTKFTTVASLSAAAMYSATVLGSATRETWLSRQLSLKNLFRRPLAMF